MDELMETTSLALAPTALAELPRPKVRLPGREKAAVLLVSLGPDATVVAPPDLTTLGAAAAARLRARYDER